MRIISGCAAPFRTSGSLFSVSFPQKDRRRMPVLSNYSAVESPVDKIKNDLSEAGKTTNDVTLNDLEGALQVS